MTGFVVVVVFMSLTAAVLITSHICATVVKVANIKYRAGKPPAERSDAPSPCQPPAGGLD